MFAVIVHVGAGFHSKTKDLLYKKLCEDACNAAVHVLSDFSSNHAALNAVVAAVSVLENSSLTNAGFGSCLNIDGQVECDAGIMCGKCLLFTSVGGVSCVRNPIEIPKHLLLRHLNEPHSSVGRVKPLSLCGEGAKQWASEIGIPLVPSDSLVSNEARSKWRKYCSLLDESRSMSRVHFKRPRLDTVGAVCLDSLGNICAATSSGGIPLKVAGRIGQATVYGCGSWAEVTPDISVGCVTSGTGEQLIKTQLAQRIASEILKQNDKQSLSDIVDSTFQGEFLHSRFLRHEETQKLGGVIGLSKMPAVADDPSSPSIIDLFVKHSTESVAFGYFVSGQTSKPIFSVSRKPESSLTGSNCVFRD
nr:threonine aspartase 1 [Hymenolepis microstoma]